MKLSFVPAAGAILTVMLEDGTVIPQDKIKSIDVAPFFTKRDGQGEALACTATSAHGSELDKFVLAASARNGKVARLAPRADKSVIPMIDQPNQPKKAAAAAAAEAQPKKP